MIKAIKKVLGIETFGVKQEAWAGDNAGLLFDEGTDVKRGDIIVKHFTDEEIEELLKRCLS